MVASEVGGMYTGPLDENDGFENFRETPPWPEGENGFFVSLVNATSFGDVPKGELACLPDDPSDFGGGDPKPPVDATDFGAEVPNGEAGCLPGDPTDFGGGDPKAPGVATDFGAKAPNGEAACLAGVP